jgi:hypothetical protein
MKNIRYDPYLYNPHNSYLLSKDDSSHFTSSDQLAQQKQPSQKNALASSTRRKAPTIFSSHLYFQLEFQLITIFIVSTFLILWFLLSNTAFWKIFL